MLKEVWRSLKNEKLKGQIWARIGRVIGRKDRRISVKIPRRYHIFAQIFVKF